jgi:hypothetical protein
LAEDRSEAPTEPTSILASAPPWALIAALGAMVWKSQNAKIDAVTSEVNTQRQNVAKVFDLIEAHARRSEDRHHEILHALHQGLERKADK